MGCQLAPPPRPQPFHDAPDEVNDDEVFKAE
jgi:hypothetical protein